MSTRGANGEADTKRRSKRIQEKRELQADSPERETAKNPYAKPRVASKASPKAVPKRTAPKAAKTVPKTAAGAAPKTTFKVSPKTAPAAGVRKTMAKAKGKGKGKGKGKERAGKENDNVLVLAIAPAALAANIATGKESIDYWRKRGGWPQRWFEPDPDAQAWLTRQSDEEYWRNRLRTAGETNCKEEIQNAWRAALAKPVDLTNTVQTLLPEDAQTDNDKGSEAKWQGKSNEAYQTVNYTGALANKGSFLEDDRQGPLQADRDLCQTLLTAEHPVPGGNFFDAMVFWEMCQGIRDRNEAMIIRYIAPTIVPSPWLSLLDGPPFREYRLAELIQQRWSCCIPFHGPRPCPYHTVGLSDSAFDEEQLRKLDAIAGESSETSFIKATSFLYLPFLTNEVKSGASPWEPAERHSAHCMTIALRGVVELFKLKARHMELQRRILGFSIIHDDKSVRIYGHYPVFEGPRTKYYRYRIHRFSFVEQHGKAKWTAYKFVMNMYRQWMPMHLDRLCSLIDELQEGDFAVSDSSLRFSIPPDTQPLETAPVVTDDSSSEKTPPAIINDSSGERTSPVVFIESGGETTPPVITIESDEERTPPVITIEPNGERTPPVITIESGGESDTASSTGSAAASVASK